jgi:hypothetical protein
VTTKLDEMWAAFEAHKPAPEYAEAWQTMCRERTGRAAWAANKAAPVGSAAAVAAWAAATAAWTVADFNVWANRYAQDAIDAIREVKP